MWDYSETVKEHFYNPRNVGAVEDANAIGDVGSLSCGDALRLTLKVNPETEVIEEAGFQTFGCGSAIASSSALTEMIKGKKLDEALEVSNQDIADYLEGLPPEKMHCSVMGREALQAAVANYRGEVWKDDHEEGALICKCFAIEEPLIVDTIKANKLSSVQDVANYTKAGAGCSACHEKIEEILDRELKARGEIFVPNAVRPDLAKEPRTVDASITSEMLAASKKATKPKFTLVQRIQKIEKAIAEVRPTLQADRGDVKLIDVQDKTVFVSLTGACVGCQMAGLTLNGLQQKIMEELGEFVQVVPLSKRQLEEAGL
ncbi:MAG: Fe-S cluster assembly protein NifU [Hyphomicrobiaceae bacterium]|nr:Fe-S cluster assembly protein NifU [Hyphomicrobiaceae bacterium]